MTDTHCHISKKDDINEILKLAKINNVIKIVNNGTNYNNNIEVLEITSNYDEIYAAIGYQPQELDNFKEEYLDLIKKNIDKIVAIGEIGLDFYNSKINHEFQKYVFEKQLIIAEKYDKPVIIHARNSYDEVIKILEKHPKIRGTIHSFTGDISYAQKFISMNFKLSFNGIITFKNSDFNELLKNIPIESILLETDSPYLSPEPLRGKKNNPSNIKYIAKKIAEIKNISLEYLEKITDKNANELFDI